MNRKPPHERATKLIQLKVTESEHALLKRAAAADMRSLGMFMRIAALRWARQVLGLDGTTNNGPALG